MLNKRIMLLVGGLVIGKLGLDILVKNNKVKNFTRAEKLKNNIDDEFNYICEALGIFDKMNEDIFYEPTEEEICKIIKEYKVRTGRDLVEMIKNEREVM